MKKGRCAFLTQWPFVLPLQPVGLFGSLLHACCATAFSPQGQHDTLKQNKQVRHRDGGDVPTPRISQARACLTTAEERDAGKMMTLDLYALVKVEDTFMAYSVVVGGTVSPRRLC